MKFYAIKTKQLFFAGLSENGFLMCSTPKKALLFSSKKDAKGSALTYYSRGKVNKISKREQKLWQL